MKDVTLFSVILLMCCVFTARCRTVEPDISDNEADFVTFLSGYYDNSAQIETNDTGRDFLQMRSRPVSLPALFKSVVFFMEWSRNGVLLNLELNDIKEDKHGVIYVTTHNFTDVRKYKPGAFNLDDLSKVKVEDLRSYNIPCVAAFSRVSRRAYVGSWPACIYLHNEKYPLYAVTLNCETAVISIPLSILESSTIVPYVLKLKGARSPLPYSRPGYTSPCE